MANKRKRIWNETDRLNLRIGFMTQVQKQDAYADMFYNWISPCKGGCGHHVHVGEFMDTQNGVCPNCGTEHETFLPLFPVSTLGRCIFKKKSEPKVQLINEDT
jgi:hypothetical protein